MKLKVISYGQRDNSWGSILLGYNTQAPYNIYNYGCLVTSLASYLKSLGQNENPSTVNYKLKANNGFQAGGGLFIWSKSTVLGLTQTYISPYYDGPVTTQGLDKIRTLLDQGYPLLCEVDFNPATIGEEMHYVLLCGYEGNTIFAMDPWQGQIVNLDIYGGPNRAILQFRAYDKILAKIDVETPPVSPELTKCQTDLASEIKKKDDNYKWGKELENELEGTNAKIISFENFQLALSGTLNCINQPTEILGEITKLTSLQDQLRQCQKNLEDSKLDEADLAVKTTGLEQELSLATSTIGKLSTSLHEAIDTLEKTTRERDALLSLQKYETIFRIWKDLVFAREKRWSNGKRKI